jgi:hypothetical protein
MFCCRWLPGWLEVHRRPQRDRAQGDLHSHRLTKDICGRLIAAWCLRDSPKLIGVSPRSDRISPSGRHARKRALHPAGENPPATTTLKLRHCRPL